jgi:hypothetical protein
MQFLLQASWTSLESSVPSIHCEAFGPLTHHFHNRLRTPGHCAQRRDLRLPRECICWLMYVLFQLNRLQEEGSPFPQLVCSILNSGQDSPYGRMQISRRGGRVNLKRPSIWRAHIVAVNGCLLAGLCASDLRALCFRASVVQFLMTSGCSRVKVDYQLGLICQKTLHLT